MNFTNKISKEVGLSEDSDEDGMPKNPAEDVNMTLNSMQARIKNIDEYEFFNKTIKLLYATLPDKAKMLVAALSEDQQKYLKGALQSKRVVISKKGEKTTVARRILKPKSGKNDSTMH